MNLVRIAELEGGGWVVQKGYTLVRAVGGPTDVWPGRGLYGLAGWMTREEALAKCMELVLTEDYQLREEVRYG